MAKAQELRELSVDDLNRRATELRETIFQDQLKLRTGTLENFSERRKHKKELAQLLTVLGEKTRSASKQAPKA
jgi:large subunit ribosomal protein L29